MTVAFSDIAGRLNRWEVDGVRLAPVRYRAQLSAAEFRTAQQAVAVDACMDALNRRLALRRPPKEIPA